jgi:hypothetical protein
VVLDRADGRPPLALSGPEGGPIEVNMTGLSLEETNAKLLEILPNLAEEFGFELKPKK